MKVEKEARKLGIEELERRSAPVIVEVTPDESPSPIDPTLPVGEAGGGGVPELEPVVDQPGNSDGHRDRLWHQNQ